MLATSTEHSLRNFNVSNKSLFAREEQKNVEAQVTNYLDIPCFEISLRHKDLLICTHEGNLTIDLELVFNVVHVLYMGR